MPELEPALDRLRRKEKRPLISIGNVAASGTEIILELGEEHQRTGKWIVYTSADSVFQVAAHEDTIPADELERRRKAWTAPPLPATRGVLAKYLRSVRSASEGCVTDE